LENYNQNIHILKHSKKCLRVHCFIFTFAAVNILCTVPKIQAAEYLELLCGNSRKETGIFLKVSNCVCPEIGPGKTKVSGSYSYS
jgi:hypothetical protein